MGKTTADLRKPLKKERKVGFIDQNSVLHILCEVMQPSDIFLILARGDHLLPDLPDSLDSQFHHIAGLQKTRR